MAQSAALTLSVEDPQSADLRVLIDQLDAELLAVYPAASLHPVDLYRFAAAGGVFIVARSGGDPAGCGAIRPLESGAAELKRVFVAPAHRRKGIARALLMHLEQTARDRGFRILRLETGAGNPEALKLYAAFGYQPIPPFGEYVHDPLSLCFEKKL